MSTARLQAPGPSTSDGPPQRLHDEITVLAEEQGVDVFVFAIDGRLLDTSPGCPATIEQVAATSSGVVNLSRGYASRGDRGGVERLVTRYEKGVLILLPVNEAVWAGCLTDRNRVKNTAHTLALFTERAAPLAPREVGLNLPAVALSATGNEVRR